MESPATTQRTSLNGKYTGTERERREKTVELRAFVHRKIPLLSIVEFPKKERHPCFGERKKRANTSRSYNCNGCKKRRKKNQQLRTPNTKKNERHKYRKKEMNTNVDMNKFK